MLFAFIGQEPPIEERWQGWRDTETNKRQHRTAEDDRLARSDDEYGFLFISLGPLTLTFRASSSSPTNFLKATGERREQELHEVEHDTDDTSVFGQYASDFDVRRVLARCTPVSSKGRWWRSSSPAHLRDSKAISKL